jgi:hypothetical protein
MGRRPRDAGEADGPVAADADGASEADPDGDPATGAEAFAGEATTADTVGDADDPHPARTSDPATMATATDDFDLPRPSMATFLRALPSISIAEDERRSFHLRLADPSADGRSVRSWAA